MAALTGMPQNLHAQISPGDLAEVHKHLEGISNCTKCHILGEKVSNEKCLDCHTEIRVRVENDLGYHASAEVAGKACVKCHNDHHGREFRIIRFEKDTFNHVLTGYPLKGRHADQACDDCHRKKYITDESVKDKKYTYLGLGTSCVNCHEDYHQGTLNEACDGCHNFETFKEAPGFDHAATVYPLAGRHRDVRCEQCHEKTTRNGKPFQRFAGIEHSGCVSCHEDVHKGKFGQNCAQCHSVQGFGIISRIDGFDHSKTDFPLAGKHRTLDCNDCHTGSYTQPIAHNRCTDCHEDYHNGQFVDNGTVRDCDACHTVNGFTPATFDLADHNQTRFKLEGAHLATPCFACHLKEDAWRFRDIGTNCADCHDDIHNGYIDAKYYPGKECTICHTVERWSNVGFDHQQTGFELQGAHEEQSCRDCHFIQTSSGAKQQRFKNLGSSCITCHDDIHYGQFEADGKVDCERCHGFYDWQANRFDHGKTGFKLDGAHENVACYKCHKEVHEDNHTFIKYKIEDYRCETCHR